MVYNTLEQDELIIQTDGQFRNTTIPGLEIAESRGFGDFGVANGAEQDGFWSDNDANNHADAANERLGCIVILFAIIRDNLNASDENIPELTWVTVWTSIESSVAVMAMPLTGFILLLTRQKQNPSPEASTQATNFKNQ
ncbi:hypothetical protein PG994_007305 [Apiospora phragmitis]|uniref:Uncharacterized protein n=1 Tax=Apiospora phragmitis TaxID=2905665 RepID=A0ABR1V0F3_9PEZI